MEKWTFSLKFGGCSSRLETRTSQVVHLAGDVGKARYSRKKTQKMLERINRTKWSLLAALRWPRCSVSAPSSPRRNTGLQVLTEVGTSVFVGWANPGVYEYWEVSKLCPIYTSTTFNQINTFKSHSWNNSWNNWRVHEGLEYCSNILLLKTCKEWHENGSSWVQVSSKKVYGWIKIWRHCFLEIWEAFTAHTGMYQS